VVRRILQGQEATHRYIAMKKLLVILSVLFFGGYLSAQSWISSSQVTSTETMTEISSTIDENGNVIIFGYFNGSFSAPNGEVLTSYGSRDYFLMKFLANGDFAWMSNYGSTAKEYSNGGMKTDAEGNIYITGGFRDYLKYSPTDSLESFGSWDIFLAKLSGNGDVIWARNAGKGSNRQSSTALTIGSTNNIVMAGSFTDSISIYDTQTLYAENSIMDCYYAEFNATNGDLNWIKHGNTISGSPGYIWDIESTENNYYLVGINLDTLGFENDTITSVKEDYNTFLLKTDLAGSIEWHRTIEGNDKIRCYTVVRDIEGNSIYIAGYFESDTLFFESSDNQFIEEIGNNGSNDIFVAKYLSNGDLEWQRTTGGVGDDRVFALEYFNNEVYVSGRFADTMYWGGKMLASSGPDDFDMFTGALTPDGSSRTANSFSSEDTVSREESRGIFQNGDELYTVMISNAKELRVGDDFYTSDGTTDYLILGVIGCRPISIDQTLYNDVKTCYGDSTGSILIVASGGFPGTWYYSIDNYETVQREDPFFPDLPAGDYQVVVSDTMGCAFTGQVVSLIQPDTLGVEVLGVQDITLDQDGFISVVATGGTVPHTYTLLPTNDALPHGTFYFDPGDSGIYVIEVNDLNNCGPVSTDSIEIKDLTHVGFKDLSDIALKVYPNPASNLVNIEMPMETSEVTMEVMSLTGQVMMSRQAYTSGGVLKETIDVSDLAKGMYMLRINGKTLRSGIVVQ